MARQLSGNRPVIDGLVIEPGATPTLPVFSIAASAAPTNDPTKGDFYVSTGGVLMVYNGSAWAEAGTAVSGASTFAAAVTFTTGQQSTVVARTATALGDGTGAIAAGTSAVLVTTDSADKIITLPAPVVNHTISIYNGATGYELRSTAPATIGINGGTSAAGESAIAASTYVECKCQSATNWICWSRIANGTLSVVQVAADA